MKRTIASIKDAFAKDAFYKTVGAAVRDMRTKRGLSQSDVCKMLRLNGSTVQNAEAGMTCSLLVLAQMADAFDCSLDELVPLEALK